MKIACFDATGMLYDVWPRTVGVPLYEDRDVAYQMDVLVLDNQKYFLSKTSDVARIPMPDFPYTSNILELSYVFKIRCGSVTDVELLPAFVRKTLQLMQASHFIWRRRDYLQVIRNYYRLGMFAEGDAFEAYYRRRYPSLFTAPEDEKHESEHENTKQYFVRKWERKQQRG